MKKLILPILILVVVIVAACQRSVQNDAMQKAAQTTKTATGDAAVDSIGSDISNAETAEHDLSDDNLSDLDSGFNDVQNI